MKFYNFSCCLSFHYDPIINMQLYGNFLVFDKTCFVCQNTLCFGKCSMSWWEARVFSSFEMKYSVYFFISTRLMMWFMPEVSLLILCMYDQSVGREVCWNHPVSFIGFYIGLNVKKCLLYKIRCTDIWNRYNSYHWIFF